jgi:mannonate dehydratase
MKLGFGFYRHQLDRAHYRFARQCGATHAVIHLVDYFRNGGTANTRTDQPTGTRTEGWGEAGDPAALWNVEYLLHIKHELAEEGLEWAAIENFDPAHWHDVLLAGPRRAEQLEQLKTLVRNVGAAGIPVIGYNFSLAGVSSRTKAPVARGGALALGLDGPNDTPVPAGMVWNMVYDRSATSGTMAPCTAAELWTRVKIFLDAVLPVAEAAGVVLAAHPDDPPLPTLRGTPRLVYQPRFYDRLLALHPSPSNQLELCLGTLAEMTEGNLYDAVDHFGATGRIAYVHFRNVHGKVPCYHETFVDDGDVDMQRVLRILHARGFSGVLIPDHTPQMTCAAPWHAGMAFAMGWMRAALQITN